MSRLLSAALPLLAACLAPDDPGPQSEPGEGTTTISVVAEQFPELVAVREGADGPWLRARRVHADEFQVFVRGPYSVLGVCGRSVRVVSQTLADPVQIALDCRVSQDARIEVLGQMSQPGVVHLGSISARSDKPFWNFLMRVPALGDFDLVAVTSERVLIREAVAIRGATRLQPIDLADATPLATVPLTVTNPRADEVLSASAYLVGPRLRSPELYSGALEAMKVAPSSVLSATVEQRVGISGSRTEGTRHVSRVHSRPFHMGDSTAVTLWDGLANVTIAELDGAPMATWSTPAHDLEHLRFEVNQQWRYELDLSSSYLQAVQPQRAAFDVASAPGFLPQWQLAAGSPYTVSLFASRGTSVRDSYTFFQQVNR